MRKICQVHNCDCTAIAVCKRCGIKICDQHRSTVMVPYAISLCPKCKEKEHGTQRVPASST